MHEDAQLCSAVQVCFLRYIMPAAYNFYTATAVYI